MRVTVEVDRASTVPTPAPHRIVAHDDAVGRVLRSMVEQIDHVVEDRLELGSPGVVVATNEQDPLDPEPLSHLGGDPYLLLGVFDIPDEVSEMDEDVVGSEHVVPAVHDGIRHGRLVGEGTIVGFDRVDLAEV